MCPIVIHWYWFWMKIISISKSKWPNLPISKSKPMFDIDNFDSITICNLKPTFIAQHCFLGSFWMFDVRICIFSLLQKGALVIFDVQLKNLTPYVKILRQNFISPKNAASLIAKDWGVDKGRILPLSQFVIKTTGVKGTFCRCLWRPWP